MKANRSFFSSILFIFLICTSAYGAEFNNLPHLNGKAIVEMKINGSIIAIEVRGDKAPVTAGNFVDLVARRFYDGLSFHRIESGYVAQGGDPQSLDPDFPDSYLGDGKFVDPNTGQPRYIPLEITPIGSSAPVYSQTLRGAGVTAPPELVHRKGAVAMFRGQAPDSASCQFYFTLTDSPQLDGNFAVFGYIVSDPAVAQSIKKGDRIESARVVSGIENLKLP